MWCTLEGRPIPTGSGLGGDAEGTAAVEVLGQLSWDDVFCVKPLGPITPPSNGTSTAATQRRRHSRMLMQDALDAEEAGDIDLFDLAEVFEEEATADPGSGLGSNIFADVQDVQELPPDVEEKLAAPVEVANFKVEVRACVRAR